ncbi:MAG: ABC transporter ATP-binding protein [Hydrogenibacillus schlegelii]|nr:ABC transporter ATP-binding protein [Hydrogenibacillus schlegelii]
MTALLRVESLTVAYGPVTAVRALDLAVGDGEIVALLGANGAGKTSTLRALSGLVRPAGGRIRFAGEDVTGLPPHALVGRGIVHVPEGRQVFGPLSVLENLELGGFTQRKDRAFLRETLAFVFELFPRLKERLHQPAGTLSGGEQQMLAIARGLMSRPRLLLLDEPSMGLAPIVVQDIFRTLRAINGRGTAILIVEQNAKAALALAHRAVVLELGEKVLEGPSEALASDPRVVDAYLAQAEGRR